MINTYRKISAKMKKEPYTFELYDDAFQCVRHLSGDVAQTVNRELRGKLRRALSTAQDAAFKRQAYELIKKTYLFAAAVDFDSYLIYVEWNREEEKKFYLPRRDRLRGVVSAMQDLVDDELVFFISIAFSL